MVVLKQVHIRANAQLFLVIHAQDNLCLHPRLAQGWQQHGRKDPNNSNNNQQLDEREIFSKPIHLDLSHQIIATVLLRRIASQRLDIISRSLGSQDRDHAPTLEPNTEHHKYFFDAAL